MKILNLDSEKFSSEAIKNYKKLGSYSSLKKISRKKLLSIIHNYDVVILRFAHKFDKELLSKARKLKLIITNTTGTDHIDEDYLVKKNIKLLNPIKIPFFRKEALGQFKLKLGLFLKKV